jgi:hypothetical protein
MAASSGCSEGGIMMEATDEYVRTLLFGSTDSDPSNNNENCSLDEVDIAHDCKQNIWVPSTDDGRLIQQQRKELDQIKSRMQELMTASSLMRSQVAQLTEWCGILRKCLHVTCEKLVEHGCEDASLVALFSQVFTFSQSQEAKPKVVAAPVTARRIPGLGVKHCPKRITDENGVDIVDEAMSIINTIQSKRVIANSVVALSSRIDVSKEQIFGLKLKSPSANADNPEHNSGTVDQKYRSSILGEGPMKDLLTAVSATVDSIARQQHVIEERGNRISALELELFRRLGLQLPNGDVAKRNSGSMGVPTPYQLLPISRENASVETILDNREISEINSFSSSELDALLDESKAEPQTSRTDDYNEECTKLKAQMEILWCALNISEDELDQTKLELATYKQGMSISNSLLTIRDHEVVQDSNSKDLDRSVDIGECFADFDGGERAQLVSKLRDLEDQLIICETRCDALEKANIRLATESQQLTRDLMEAQNVHRGQLRGYADKCADIQRLLNNERSRFENILKMAEIKLGSS